MICKSILNPVQRKQCPKCRSELISVNEKYCPKCTKAKQKQYYQDRNKEHQHLYGRWWQRARLSYLAQYPRCVKCLAKNGRPEPATVVDHIIPHKGDLNLFRDVSNWQPLCKRHHDKKTATEGAFGK